MSLSLRDRKRSIVMKRIGTGKVMMDRIWVPVRRMKSLPDLMNLRITATNMRSSLHLMKTRKLLRIVTK